MKNLRYFTYEGENKQGDGKVFIDTDQTAEWFQKSGLFLKPFPLPVCLHCSCFCIPHGMSYPYAFKLCSYVYLKPLRTFASFTVILKYLYK